MPKIAYSVGRRLICALACALVATSARADLYGYVDAQGQVHLANERLDERYQLFIKGETRREFKLASELKYLPATAALQDHIIFKRIQKSPNVGKFDPLVLSEANKQRLDPALVKAVIAVESAYDPAAVSPKGAVGLMQLIPGTAARYGVRNSTEPKDNVSGGTRYLRDLLDLFKGDLALALAGYNAGEGAVMKYKNTIPPFPETQAYVKLVMQFYEHFGGGAKKLVAKEDSRIRITLPGRRNMPLAGDERAAALLAGAPGATQGVVQGVVQGTDSGAAQVNPVRP